MQVPAEARPPPAQSGERKNTFSISSLTLLRNPSICATVCRANAREYPIDHVLARSGRSAGLGIALPAFAEKRSLSVGKRLLRTALTKIDPDWPAACDTEPTGL